MPLAKGQALSIGLTSYDGGVYYGLNADRDAMPDVDVLGQCIVDVARRAGQREGVLMPVVRVYVPLGRTGLDELATTGRSLPVPAPHAPAYAVTSGLEKAAPGLDVEDLEYAAFSDAVEAAVRLRVGALRPPGRRVRRRRSLVGVAARRRARVEGRAHRTGAASRVASFHVDDEVTGGVDEEADELLWYDVTELDDVRSFFG